MTTHDALVRAVCAHPDDDTPRLVYADFLDEVGEPERAAFVRAQLDLARTPAWEPLAVRCRHQRQEWSEAGSPFRAVLPAFPPGWSIQWHDRPFRRGLGWRVVIGSLHAWAEVAPRLFDDAPVGEVHLRAPATLDDWKQFAVADSVRRLQSVHLETGSPVEPIRSLCESPASENVSELAFHVATSPGLPLLVADLLRTRFGQGLRGLSFRLGDFAALEDLIEALTSGPNAFERLALTLMGLTSDLLQRWCERGGPRGLRALDLTDNYTLCSERGGDYLAEGFHDAGAMLHTLVLAGTSLTDAGVKALAGCAGLAGLRHLDLSRNPFPAAAVRALAESPALAGLRSLALVRCRIGDRAVRRLTRARFWPNLVELDLRQNPITDPGARDLLAAPIPPDLTALVLDAKEIRPRMRAALRRHFGERIVLSQDDR